MVGFIDLLLSNPLLLFFAIAALLSFFQGGNKKEDQKRKTTAPNRPNREVRRSREAEIDWREIFRQESAPVERKPQQRPLPSREHTAESRSRQTTSYSTPLQMDEELNKANNDLHEKYERLKEKQKLTKEKVQQFEESPIFTGEKPKKASSRK